MEAVFACLVYGGLKEGGSEGGAPSAKAWWAERSYQEALEEMGKHQMYHLLVEHLTHIYDLNSQGKLDHSSTSAQVTVNIRQ